MSRASAVQSTMKNKGEGMQMNRSHSVFTYLGLSVLALFLLGVFPTTSNAANSSCWKDTQYLYECHWGANPTITDIRVYFDSAVRPNNQDWSYVEVRHSNLYTNDMVKKCAGIKDPQGDLHSIACGGGDAIGSVNPYWTPAWAYVRHWAGGYRDIYGHGKFWD
jgi:hypothetical protein